MPSFQEFRLPDAGEGLTEAEIVAWQVAVGDVVRVNQPLVEIETAKSLVELPSPWDGVVTEILVQPGTTVDVGTPIVRIDVDPTGSGEEAHDEAVAVAQALALEAGTGAEGADKAGASGAVLVGYGVAEPGSGRRARRRTPATPELSERGPGIPGPRSDNRRTTEATGATGATSGASRPTGADGAVHPTVLAKPPVRKLARDLGVDLTGVHATGPGGIVTREDLVEYAKAAAQPRSLATYADDDAPWLASGQVSGDGRQTRVPVKSVRRRTAEAMVASAFSAPHVTEFHTVDVTRTMKLVAELREDREFAGVRVTPLLIAAKALLLAVHRHPEINASWDAGSQEIVYKHYVNLGIAAATPRGLVVPNIKDAHRLNLKGIADALADLTATARAGRTSPADMSDGTITITNVGVFGIDTGTPILNPGEAAILAFGAIREQPWVHKGKIKKRWVTQLALSFDHRLVDGELGARFLADIAAVLQDPARALVWG